MNAGSVTLNKVLAVTGIIYPKTLD